jgi:hypothetical protein
LNPEPISLGLRCSINVNIQCVAPVALPLTLAHFSSLQTLAHY